MNYRVILSLATAVVMAACSPKGCYGCRPTVEQKLPITGQQIVMSDLEKAAIAGGQAGLEFARLAYPDSTCVSRSNVTSCSLNVERRIGNDIVRRIVYTPGSMKIYMTNRQVTKDKIIGGQPIPTARETEVVEGFDTKTTRHLYTKKRVTDLLLLGNVEAVINEEVKCKDPLENDLEVKDGDCVPPERGTY